MKIMSIAITLLVSSLAQAKSLECYSFDDYTATDVTINRDGSIGFNGTFVTLDSQSRLLVTAPDVTTPLSTLTGRKNDEKSILRGLVLPLSPKASCSQNGDALDVDFSCDVKGARITATGEEWKVPNDFSPVTSETIVTRTDLKADVVLKATMRGQDPTIGVQKRKLISLEATVTEPASGHSVIVQKLLSCKIVNR